MNAQHEQAQTRFWVGLGLWGQARELLEIMKFNGHNIEWHEGRGWITRTFYVKGDKPSIDAIDITIANWSRQLDNPD